MSTIKTTVKKITDRIKNYRTHVARPGRHGLPGMMNTGYDAAPQKGMGKSSPMKKLSEFDAFKKEGGEGSIKGSGTASDPTSGLKSIGGTIAKKAGQRAASKGAQKGVDTVADKHGINSPNNYGKKKY